MSNGPPFPAGYIPNPKDDSPYGYIPTFSITVLFVTLFSITTLGHGIQAIRYRLWWMLPSAFACGLIEIIGWSGRLWSSKNPWIMDPYLMQICCTIFAPTFLTAAMFIIFGRLIEVIGFEYSRLKPKAYAYIFIGADVTALVVQSAGGAMASMADTHQGSENGAHIMVVGIFIQMAAITVYAVVVGEYLFRVFKQRPLRVLEATSGSEIALQAPSEGSYNVLHSKDVRGRDKVTRPIGLMIIGLIIATVFIYIRSIYRTIELLDGWNGEVITNQTLFNVLDGTPVFLAMLTLNVLHPGRLVPSRQLPRTAV